MIYEQAAGGDINCGAGAAVGAVYDRAFSAFERDERAVYDRAYIEGHPNLEVRASFAL